MVAGEEGSPHPRTGSILYPICLQTRYTLDCFAPHCPLPSASSSLFPELAPPLLPHETFAKKLTEARRWTVGLD